MNLLYGCGNKENETVVYEGASADGLLHTIRLKDNTKLSRKLLFHFLRCHSNTTDSYRAGSQLISLIGQFLVTWYFRSRSPSYCSLSYLLLLGSTTDKYYFHPQCLLVLREWHEVQWWRHSGQSIKLMRMRNALCLSGACGYECKMHWNIHGQHRGGAQSLSWNGA